MKKKSFKRLISFVLGAALITTAGSALTGCGTGAGSKTGTASRKISSVSSGKTENKSGLETVRVGFTTNLQNDWLVKIAKEKGIFEKNGLNVESTEFPNGISSVDAMATGQLDIGEVADFAGVNRIGQTPDKSDLVFVSTCGISNAFNFYVNPDKIKDLKDLKGQSIAVSLGVVLEYWNARTIEEAGLSKKDVKEIPIEDGTETLALAKSGKISGTWSTAVNAQKLVQNYKWKPLVNQKELGLSMYSYLVSTKAYVKEHKETISKYIKSLYEANQYVKENIDDAAGIIKKTSQVDEDTFKTEYKALDIVYGFSDDSVKDLETIEKWVYKNGYTKGEYDVKDHIDTSAVEEADADPVETQYHAAE